MPSWGAHTYLWASSAEYSELAGAIHSASAMGLDFVQVSVSSPDLLDVAAVRDSLVGNRISVVTGLAVPNAVWAARRRGGLVKYLVGAVDATVALGATILSGALYTPMGLTTPPTFRKQEFTLLRRSMKEVAQYARERGVRLGLEPLNRYETSLINTCAQVVEFASDIDEMNVFVQLDTFHMNIEERDLYSAFLLAGARLGYVQLAESDRGVPGGGHVPWDAVFAGLRDLAYDGPIAFESFTTRNREMSRASCLWRDVVGDPDEFVARGMNFVRERAVATSYLRASAFDMPAPARTGPSPARQTG